MTRRVALAVSLVAAMLGIGVLRGHAMDRYLATASYEDVYYLPPPAWLRVFSLGHDEALADLLWMRALIYFGEELGNQGRGAHTLEYGEAIVALDPHFKAVYSWVGVGALYHAGEVSVDECRQAADFIERGVRLYPDDGRLSWDLGATLAYELAPRLTDPQEKEAVIARANRYLVHAARLGAGPPWLVLANAAQLARLGRTEQALRHLEEMYATISDDALRQRIGERIASLRSQAYAEAFERVNRDFEESRRREYPYLPPTMYLLVGPRITPGLDPLDLLHQTAPGDAGSPIDAGSDAPPPEPTPPASP